MKILSDREIKVITKYAEYNKDLMFKIGKMLDSTIKDIEDKYQAKTSLDLEFHEMTDFDRKIYSKIFNVRENHSALVKLLLHPGC